MAKETLVVKNFGPIREAELDLRKVTVLIGQQASGKSVLAKLVAIFSDLLLSNEYRVENRFEAFGIKDYLKDASFIKFIGEKHSTSFTKDDFKNEITEPIILDDYLELQDLEQQYLKSSQLIQKPQKTNKANDNSHIQRSILRSAYWKKRNELKSKILVSEYFPAERTFMPTIVNAIFGLLDAKVEIPEIITNFGQLFESAKKNKEYLIPILGVKYSFQDENIITLPNGTKLKLDHTSSGFQSLIPMLVVLESLAHNNKQEFVIEEPELNLYPTTQKKLVEYLVGKCTKGDNRLIITTHSPYILTALNNCIEAKNAIKANPEAAAEINQLVPPEFQLDYEDVMAYYVADGTARPIMNEEYQIIDANALDDVSEELGRVFDRLLDLKYQHQE